MTTYVADCETNGLFEQLDKVHSLCFKSSDGSQAYSCADQPGYMGIEEGLEKLMAADKVVFANGIKFDLPALRKVYPWFDLSQDQMVDTLVLSRLIWPDLGNRDYKLIKRGKLPPKLRGSHSLKAWGIRLGVLKGDFGEDTDWQTWTPDMQSYCEQDVEVTLKLWDLIKRQRYSQRAIDLEHKFCHVIAKQERFGFKFDKDKGAELYVDLMGRRAEIDSQLQEMFPPWMVKVCEQTPKRNNKQLGYVEGCTFTKIKLKEFNPGSRKQIAERLIAYYGWKPKDHTENGTIKVDETILKALDYPAAPLLAERFMLEKRIGQLAEGAAAWLKLEKNGRLHGSVNTNGAVTGRCTHAAPNMAQVPSTSAPFGADCRELFTVDDGYVLIGADASGLELRCLAHFMAKWDDGKYAEAILKGSKDDGTDIHSMNQKAAGLPTRDNAKTFIYGFLYGAGDAKVGKIVGKGPKAGKALKGKFLKQTPALAKLKEAIEEAVDRKGYLKGIDGRKLHVRSAHAALNTLLQSAGGLLVKQATINLYEDMEAAGYVWGFDWAMVAHVHDEYQLQVRKGIADDVARRAEEAFRKAGRDFNWRMPLDGEAQIGANWKDTH